MNHTQLIDWLLKGDVSIQYQTQRDLLDTERKSLRTRIAAEGWGARFLSKQNRQGHWGRGFYQPKWTCTHYTLLDLKNLAISPGQAAIKQTIKHILDSDKSPDGGIYPIGSTRNSDVCINGTFLNYASYFGADARPLQSIVDFLLHEYMPDGGFNCYSNRRGGAVHSSLHSTLSVLEGIQEYESNGYTYRIKELLATKASAIEFLLIHKLFRSHRSSEIIDKKMLMLSYPSRWRFDILRALDYFQLAGVSYDRRMDDAIEILLRKRHSDGTWPLQARHPGQLHFEMEKVGQPSRWNTLRALRVLKHFNLDSK